MTYKHKSRWSRIILLCLCLSVVEQSSIRKTYSCEFIAGIIGHEFLYAATMFAGALVSRAWNNAPYSSADHTFQQDVSQLAHTAVTPSSPSLLSKQQRSPVVHAPTYVHPEPITRHIPPEVVHKTANIVDSARAVALHVTQEQESQVVVPAVTSQELIHAVSVDWHRQIEEGCQQRIKFVYANMHNQLLEDIQHTYPRVTKVQHENGGTTYYAPNPQGYLHIEPSPQRSSGQLFADRMLERKLELLYIRLNPYVYEQICDHISDFIIISKQLVYGSLAERVLALLHIDDIGIGGDTYGRELAETKQALYAAYCHKDGSVCMQALQDMRTARSILRNYHGICRRHLSLFEAPALSHEDKQVCKQLCRKIRKVNFSNMHSNKLNHCYRQMLLAFAAGNMQQVEQIKDKYGYHQDLEMLYDALRAEYDKIVQQQEALLHDEYGILHFNLSSAIRDPFYTRLSDTDREQLHNNHIALKSFNDLLRLRRLYKHALHKAWNIPDNAHPTVHQALYALIDCGPISERIDKIHEVVSNPDLSKREQIELVDALFLPNGIIKDFADYERVKTLQMPRAILQLEHSSTRKLLNQLVYAERVCSDQYIQDGCAQAIEYLQKAVLSDNKDSAVLYHAYAQDIYQETIAATMLFNSQQQPTNPGQPPQKNKSSPGGKKPKNDDPQVGAAAVALLQAIDESKEKAIEVFNKTCDWLNSGVGQESVMHAFRINCEHNFGPLFARVGVNLADESDVGVKLVLESGTKMLIDVSQKLIDMGTKLNINSRGVFENILIQYSGELITVQGRIHDGILKISTMFIRPEHVR